jgi:hypothetical protein
VSITSCYDQKHMPTQLGDTDDIPFFASAFSFTRRRASFFHASAQGQRHGIYRSFVDCDPAPNSAAGIENRRHQGRTGSLLQTAARRLRQQRLHDAGPIRHARHHLSRPADHHDPLRQTNDQVVGTISLIRESAIGFPLQRIFDLSAKSANKPATLPKYRRWPCTRNSDGPAAPSSSR